jgi:hypothetical protein
MHRNEERNTNQKLKVEVKRLNGFDSESYLPVN